MAEALGLARDELDELEWEIEDHESAEGLLYGHNIIFGEGSSAEILARLSGLTDGKWVRIGPLANDDEAPKDPF